MGNHVDNSVPSMQRFEFEEIHLTEGNQFAMVAIRPDIMVSMANALIAYASAHQTARNSKVLYALGRQLETIAKVMYKEMPADKVRGMALSVTMSDGEEVMNPDLYGADDDVPQGATATAAPAEPKTVKRTRKKADAA